MTLSSTCYLSIIFALFFGSCKVGAQAVAVADPAQVIVGNPIITEKFTADPAAFVYKDTVYLYTGHDEAPPQQERYIMHDWLLYSSTDMLQWKEHPVPLTVKDFAWAKDDAWASQVIERNGKFYWYVAVEHGTIPGKAIGVAVADRPTGPFKDARGSAIITNNMTTDTKITLGRYRPFGNY